jgi:hypothetical protein
VVVGVAVTAVAAGAVALAGDASTQGRQAGPARNGLIAFTRSGQRGIYVMRPDGSGVRVLVRPQGTEEWYASPAWSPGGRRLAFLCTDSDDPWGVHRAVCVVGLAGGEPQRPSPWGC